MNSMCSRSGLLVQCVAACLVGAALASYHLSGKNTGAPQASTLQVIHEVKEELGIPFEQAPVPLEKKNSLRCKVFADADFSAEPIREGIIDLTFNLETNPWLQDATRKVQYQFALRMEGYLKVEEEGIHSLHLSADNNYRLVIEDSLGHSNVFEQWTSDAMRGKLIMFRARPGFYRVRLEHYTDGGGAFLTAHFEASKLAFYPEKSPEEERLNEAHP